IGSDLHATAAGINVGATDVVNSIYIWNNVFFNTAEFAAHVSPGAQGRAIVWSLSTGSLIKISGNDVNAFINVGGGIGYSDQNNQGQIMVADFSGYAISNRWSHIFGRTGDQPGISLALVSDNIHRILLGLDGSDIPFLAFGPGNARDT